MGKEPQPGILCKRTKVILYTYKHKYELPAEPLRLDGIPLKFSQEVKHLGVWLDPKLKYTNHLDKKIKEGKSVICRLKGSMGKIWGLL